MRRANSSGTLASLRDRLLRAMLREESPGSNVPWYYCDEEGAGALQDIIGVKRERERERKREREREIPELERRRRQESRREKR